MGIQPPDLRFRLKIGEEEYTLPHSPAGWEEALLNWKRSLTYWGMIRTYTVPMKFVLDGAWLLRREFYMKGVQAPVTFLVDQLDRRTWSYENIYAGDIDFSRFVDTDNFVEVNVMEAGASAKVKAYEGVKYEIEMDVPEAVTIRLPGIPAVEKGECTVETYTFVSEPVPPSGLRQISAIPGISVMDQDFTGVLTVQPVIQIPGGFDPTTFPESDSWFVKADEATKIRIHGTLVGAISGGGSGNFNLHIVSSKVPPVQIAHTIISLPPIEYDYSIDFDFEYNMQAGEKLFLAVVGPPTLTSNSMSVGGTLAVSRSLITEATTCLALRPSYVFARLMDKMNGGFVPTQSFLLREWDNLVITCGDAIRRIDRPKLKTSFKDFFTSMHAVLNAGFGFQAGNAVLEEMAYFFQRALPIVRLTGIKDFSLEPAVDLLYSNIKIGYPDNDYERDEGRGEYNSTQVYSTPITRMQRELNLLSAYRADQFGIEEARLITPAENRGEKDNKTDNDVFLVHVKKEPDGDGIFDVIGREDFTSVEGVPAGDRYNLMITPKRNLYRHGRFLHSMLDRLDNNVILFQSAEKNSDLVTVKDGRSVFERADVQIASLGDKMFLPYIATITAALPRNIQKLLTDFPTGYVEFEYRNKWYRGFVLEASADVARNSARTFKLLITADSNLQGLVR